jgi:hypothetical protein
MSMLQLYGGSPKMGHNTFWGEMAPCEHLVQIYENHPVFLDSLEGFLAGGLAAGDGVIVIATSDHLAALDARLEKQGFNLDAARSQDHYIALDAEETLSKFMVSGWPDEDLFEQLVSQLIARARGNGRRVRAFGEMVAVLWAGGHNGATVRLEHLWHAICQKEAFSLFCAYPKIGFTQDAESSLKDICAAHSRVLAA